MRISMRKNEEYEFDDEDLDGDMTETQKIEKLLEKYGPYFRLNDMDVCRSLKGKWYFFRYDEKYDNYEIFTRFETASELIQLVIGELAMDATFLVENDYDMTHIVHEELGDFIHAPLDYERCIKELQKKLNVLFELSTHTY